MKARKARSARKHARHVVQYTLYIDNSTFIKEHYN